MYAFWHWIYHLKKNMPVLKQTVCSFAMENNPRELCILTGTRVLYASVEFWTWWFFLLSDNRTGKLLRKNLVFTSPHFFNTSPPKWAFGKKTSFFLTNRISSALHHSFPVTPFSGSCKKRFPRPRKWLLVSPLVTG